MKFFFNDFSGGLDFSLSKSQLGLNTKRIFWSDSENVEIHENKGIIKQKGNTLFLKTPDGAKITGLFEYDFQNIKLLLLTTSKGNFYSYNSKTKNIILEKSQMDVNSSFSFVKFLSGVVLSNGVDPPFYYDYGLSQKIQSCNAFDRNNLPILGKAIASFGGRLWIANSKTIYFSALGTYNDWTSSDDAGFISDFHTDFAEIIAIKPYKEFLVIYKKNQTYLLSGNNTGDFSIINFADKGACSPSSVVNIENKQYFFNMGVFCLNQTGELSQLQMNYEISDRIKSVFINADESRFSEVITLLYEAKNQVWFFIPQLADEYMNLIWIYDYKNNAWLKRRVPQNVCCACNFDGKILIGCENSSVFVEDTNKTFDGEPISFFWKSPFFALQNPNERKSVDEMHLLVDNNAENSFALATYIDYDDQNRISTDLINVIDDNVMIWDALSSIWDSSSPVLIYSIFTQTYVKSNLYGSNYSFQLEIYGNEIVSDIALIGLEFKEIYED